MVRLQLLCHAATAATKGAIFPADEPLSDQGLKLIEAGLPHLRPSRRCVTSPERRTRQTAEALQRDAFTEPGLRECDYGRWAGRSYDDIQHEEADGLLEWLRNPDASPHGGESLASLMQRVQVWLDMQSKSAKDSVLVVTHQSVIRSVIVSALGAPRCSFWRIDVAPLTCATLSGHGGRWTLDSLTPRSGR